MTPALRWTLVVAIESLLIVLMLPFGFVFTASLPVHQLQMAVLAIAGGIGWVAVLRRPTSLPLIVIVAPVPLLVASAFTSVVSPYPTLSWPATWQVAAYSGIFWLLALQASHPMGRRNLIGAIGLVVFLVLLSYVLAVAMAWRSWLELGFPVTSLPLRPANSGGLALIPTWFADLMATAAPLLVAALWRRGARVPAGALAAIALGAIVLTGTRSVLLLLIGLFVVTLVIVAGRRRGGRTVAIAGLASVGIGAAGIAVLLASARSFDEGRFSAYASAVDRFAEAPLLGGGPGTYGVRRMSDVVDSIGHLAFPDAHNIVLNTLAETGAVGLVGLGITVFLLAGAMHRTWLDARAERPIVVGALFGVAVLAGHGMVDVVFALIGIIVLAIAAVALAVTHEGTGEPISKVDVRFAYGPLLAGVAVVVLSSVGALRTEMTFTKLDAADASLTSSPATALAIATEATESSPDSVPAWWVRMAAADATGDIEGAIASARKTIELEGFGQEWMSLAILAARSGDQGTELEAIDAALRGPIDSVVRLNAAILLADAGDIRGALDASRDLLEMQPDIEPILGGGPPALASTIATVRHDAARDRLTATDTESAFLIALSGEDRSLADELLTEIAKTDPDAGAWSLVVGAWFGDGSALAELNTVASATPTRTRLAWLWRLAAHACDTEATNMWEKSVELGYGYQPTVPVEVGVAPDFQAWMLPTYYPSFLWRLDHPQRPYVGGTYTYSVGRPPCVSLAAG
jgi:O-antigen ligase